MSKDKSKKEAEEQSKKGESVEEVAPARGPENVPKGDSKDIPAEESRPVEDLEDNNEHRHGTAPSDGREQERTNERVGSLEVNGQTNAQEFSDEEKAKLEKELSKDNIVARVITWSGKYLKVKFFKDNKPFAIYKGKDGTREDAAKLRDEVVQKQEDMQS